MRIVREASASLFIGENMNNTIKYLVYKNNKEIGSFKNLSLGIAQIERTCLDDIAIYQIRDIKTGDVLWDGSIDGSTTKVSVDA